MVLDGFKDKPLFASFLPVSLLPKEHTLTTKVTLIALLALNTYPISCSRSVKKVTNIEAGLTIYYTSIPLVNVTVLSMYCVLFEL